MTSFLSVAPRSCSDSEKKTTPRPLLLATGDWRLATPPSPRRPPQIEVEDRARDGVTGPRKEGSIGFSVVRGGEVFRNLSGPDLRARLNEFLFDAEARPTAAAAATAADVAA